MTSFISWRHVLLLPFAAALFVGSLTCPVNAADAVVSVGAGSYRTTKPGPIKPMPEKIWRTDYVKGATPTNQWWSSLILKTGNKKFSQPLFAHPMTVTCTEKGAAVAYLGAKVNGGKDITAGNPDPKQADFELGHSAVPTFSEALCDGYSDWFVTAAFISGDKSLRASIGHGSPFVYAVYQGGSPTISAKAAPQVWHGAAKDAALGVTINGHHYGLFGPAGSSWTGIGSNTLTNNSNGKSYFSLALLPDNKPETLALFQKVAHNHVTDTAVDWKVDGGLVRSTYKFTTKQYESDSSSGTIFALYPHQWKYATTKLTDLKYGSVRGEMKIGTGESFATEVPIQGVLPLFPAQGIPDAERAVRYVRQVTDKKAGSKDTYWEGKTLGRYATLSGVSEAAGDKALQKKCVDELKHRLEDWFTATANKDKTVFYYDSNWGTLVGSPPSYGSDFPLNDHHFHYGYFIRAAAEVARLDPAWGKKWAPMVNLVVREIASIDRKDLLFPYMRCYDRYAGHSWASGDANFVDGNNQESSSESLNAWYGLILWGQATGDMATRDLGLFLFNTERTAVEEYWFDVHGTNYPKEFQNVALGMIWGGKGAFATWYSGDIDCIHGINWLPFTPASIYMGRVPEYVKKNHDRIVEKRKGGQDYNNGWGDLVCMFNALQDPASAAKYIDENPSCKIEDGNSHAFMYHWIHTLDKLGRNDSGVTADYPMQNVFRKNGKNTYVVYNYSAQPLTVKFSDGKVVTAKFNGLVVDPPK